MQSVIFHYIDKDMNMRLGIGQEEYMHEEIRQNARQLFDILGIVHTEEQWEELCSLTEEDLGTVLEGIMEDNVLYVERIQ